MEKDSSTREPKNIGMEQYSGNPETKEYHRSQ